ncbi:MULTISPECIES: YafY family protein [unclassified Ruminococcus]|uniref:helix-turn-helix transcriptional regulator n=1 Tax=unclassified Ruminococcus TaxID=2608920 RepID=UPI00210BAFEF|nr:MULTISPECIES: WYL domain-containing protein [unclassified Ruminococcus]
MDDKETLLKRLRCEYILEYLRENTDSEHCANSNTIIEYLAENGIRCGRKTVYDSITALKLFGYEILKGATSNDGYFLAERTFQSSEVRVMVDAVTSAPFITEKKTRELRDKLLKFMSRHQREQILAQLSPHERVKSQNEQIYYVIDEINRAIASGRQVEFDYYKYELENGKPNLKKQRHFAISPYALVWANDKYYLVGNYDKYDNLSNYRLDKMKMISITEQAARPYSDICGEDSVFDTTEYVKKNIMMYNGEETEMELICDYGLLDVMVDKFGVDAVTVDELGEKFSLRTTVFYSAGLIDWLFQYCDRIKILSPQRLKDRIREKAESTMKLIAE